MTSTRCRTTLLNGQIEVVINDISLPCCELNKADEYNVLWPCGSLLIVNHTDKQVTVRIAKVRKGDPLRQILPNTEKLVQIPPKGNAQIAYYRDPSQDEIYMLSVVQLVTESKAYTLAWALVSAVITGIVVAIAMNAYQKGHEKAKGMVSKG